MLLFRLHLHHLHRDWQKKIDSPWANWSCVAEMGGSIFDGNTLLAIEIPWEEIDQTFVKLD
jgi:hypothetical protein